MDSRWVTSRVDGARLEVRSAGTGPDVVLVQGGGTDASSYRRLVDRLSRRARVHVLERRGRGRSADRPDDYNLASESGDIASVLVDTGAVRVLGHSVGGLFALQTALEEPVEYLALYDPSASIDGSHPMGFLPAFEQAVDDDPVGAIVIAARGLQNPGSNLPTIVQRAMVRGLMLTPPGRTMVELIHTVPAESRLAAQADGPASRWSGVTARTTILVGARSPSYYLPAARALAAAMPDAHVRVIDKQGHDGLARAPHSLIATLCDTLAIPHPEGPTC